MSNTQLAGRPWARPAVAALLLLEDMVEAGTLKAVIDRTYPLSEVPSAMRYLDQGHARGKVVIAV